MTRSAPEGPIPVERDADAAWIDMKVASRLFGAIPRQIGRYTILETLGCGGMGLVYRAHDPVLERVVAIKLLNADWSTPDGGRRLHREARAMARLSHPNVVQIYEVGHYDERVFLAMEYIEGDTLETWLDRRPSRAEIFRLFLQIADGVAAAHGVGVTHRDLKPSNILVDARGVAKVADFGLARTNSALDLEHETTDPDIPLLATLSTEDGLFAGTLRYMSPEQHLARRSDARSDQYTYCLMLWEALCGERPIPEPTRIGGLKDADWVPRPPPRAANLPARVRKALVRGLDVDPDRRWPDMAALLAELARPDWVRRHPLALTTVAVAALSATIGWIFTIYAPTSQPPPEPFVCDPEHNPLVRLAHNKVDAWSARLDSAPGIEPVQKFIQAEIDVWYREATALCESSRRGATERELRRAACVVSGAHTIDSSIEEMSTILANTDDSGRLLVKPFADSGVPDPEDWTVPESLWRFCPTHDMDVVAAWHLVLSAEWRRLAREFATVPMLLRLGWVERASAKIRTLEPPGVTLPASFYLNKAKLMHASGRSHDEVRAATERAEYLAESQGDDATLFEARLTLAREAKSDQESERERRRAEALLPRLSDPHGERRLRLLLLYREIWKPEHEAQLRKILREASQIGPSNALALLLSARAERLDFFLAQPLFEQAIALAADDDVRGYINFSAGDFFSRLGEARLAKLHTDAALNHYEALYPKGALVFANIGYTIGINLYYSGESAAGLEYAEMAIVGFRAHKELHPLASALHLRSAIHLRAGDAQRALDDAVEALEAFAMAPPIKDEDAWRISFQTAHLESLVAHGDLTRATALAQSLLRELSRRPELNEDNARDEIELALAKALYLQNRPRQAARILARAHEPGFLASNSYKLAEALELRSRLPGLSTARVRELRAQVRALHLAFGRDGALRAGVDPS